MSVLWRVRATVLILVGVVALHHARYAVTPPAHEHEGAPSAFAAAHEYLGWLAPMVAVLVFLGLAHFAGSLRAAPGAPPALPRGRTLWLAATATLLAVFAGQETAESWLTHGYRPELLASFGAGGWVALPLAAAMGALIALLLRGAARVVAWAIARAARRSARRAATAPTRPFAVALAPRTGVLARNLAGRAPPFLS